MRIPTIQGSIARRLLVNYCIDPPAIEALLPAPFRPKLLHGAAIAGICLIRLEHIRPRGVPSTLGITSENAAHRIAVEWDEHGHCQQGVFIPRRDTNSRFNTLVGGRLFPGMHHHAHFTTTEKNGSMSITLTSDDRKVRMAVSGRAEHHLPATSLFSSLAEASHFFEQGSVGYSVTRNPERYDGLELRSHTWRVEPFAVEQVTSSFFDDHKRFPAGTVRFDCALLMQNIAHEWHGREQLCSVTQAAG